MNASKVELTASDFEELAEIVKLSQKVDRADEDYVTSISAEIFQYQPFLLSVIIGYRFDLSAVELEEIMKNYFLVWESVKNNHKVFKTKVTKSKFEKSELKTKQMIFYLNKETNQQDIFEGYFSRWGNLRSKALMTSIIHRYNTRDGLIEMKLETRGITLIGTLSFIECFENL